MGVLAYYSFDGYDNQWLSWEGQTAQLMHVGWLKRTSIVHIDLMPVSIAG
jgi:hypothetical protein